MSEYLDLENLNENVVSSLAQSFRMIHWANRSMGERFIRVIEKIFKNEKILRVIPKDELFDGKSTELALILKEYCKAMAQKLENLYENFVTGIPEILKGLLTIKEVEKEKIDYLEFYLKEIQKFVREARNNYEFQKEMYASNALRNGILKKKIFRSYSSFLDDNFGKLKKEESSNFSTKKHISFGKENSREKGSTGYKTNIENQNSSFKKEKSIWNFENSSIGVTQKINPNLNFREKSTLVDFTTDNNSYYKENLLSPSYKKEAQQNTQQFYEPDKNSKKNSSNFFNPYSKSEKKKKKEFEQKSFSSQNYNQHTNTKKKVAQVSKLDSDADSEPAFIFTQSPSKSRASMDDWAKVSKIIKSFEISSIFEIRTYPLSQTGTQILIIGITSLALKDSQNGLYTTQDQKMFKFRIDPYTTKLQFEILQGIGKNISKF